MIPKNKTRKNPAKKKLGTGELPPDWMSEAPWWKPGSSPLQDLPRHTTGLDINTSWMANNGILVVDRGYPVVPWVCSISVGNHVIYKNQGETGGYPYLLARGWKALGWREGTALAASAVKVPGVANTWWVPRWCTAEYLSAVSRVWDSFALSIHDVCIRRPQRYASLAEAHRRYYIGPWVRKQLRLHYPHQAVLAAMGYPADRKTHVKELVTKAMANYPSPHELMAGVWTSKPWILSAAPPPPINPNTEWWGPTTVNTRKSYRGSITPITVFNPWDDPLLTNAIAVEAADKHWPHLHMSAWKIIKWLSINPKTGRYDTIRPVKTLKIYISKVNRLRAWMGPGADHDALNEMATTASEILNAGATLNKAAPDNPWRTYYRNRLSQIAKAVETREYRAATKAWWRTGDPAQAPRTKPLLTYNRP